MAPDAPPRLTIVIPTFNRPELLPRALDSALKQTVPVRVIIADDGDTETTAALLAERYAEILEAGVIVHLRTGADNAWDNWRAGAEAAETEFVAWLQDDDLVRPTYVRRIVGAFDNCPEADVWMARLACAPDGRMGCWYLANGPWVPMDLIDGQPYSFGEGSILASTSYFTSWSLSPALAYRNNDTFRRALRAMPPRCDMFVERLIPALAADGGRFIADPVIAGYWIQHGDQLSQKQYPDQPRQTRLLVPVLDELLDRLEGWEESLAAWCQLIQSGQIVQWVGQLEVTEKEGGKSRHGDAIRRIMVDSLRNRVAVIPGRPWWRRALSAAARPWRRRRRAA